MIGELLRSARRYENQGKFIEAKSLYNKALKIDWSSETARKGLSRIEEKIHNKSKTAAICPSEMIRRMLNHPEKLTKSQRWWVKEIKQTSDNFYRINFTPRQRKVIEDIYNKFQKRV